jgi:hypothetical protein
MHWSESRALPGPVLSRCSTHGNALCLGCCRKHGKTSFAGTWRLWFRVSPWLEDESSSIVKTMALQGLADLAGHDPTLLPMVLDLLRLHGRSGTPAMRARSRLLLQQLEGSGEGKKNRKIVP